MQNGRALQIQRRHKWVPEISTVLSRQETALCSVTHGNDGAGKRIRSNFFECDFGTTKSDKLNK